MLESSQLFEKRFLWSTGLKSIDVSIGRPDITEMMLKMALNIIQSINKLTNIFVFFFEF